MAASFFFLGFVWAFLEKNIIEKIYLYNINTSHFFTNAFCQVSDKDTVLSKKNNLTIDEVRKNIISFYSMEKLIKIFNDYIPDSRKDYISDLKILNNIYLDMECYIIVITEKESISFYLGFIQNKKVEFYKFFGSSYLNFKENEI